MTVTALSPTANTVFSMAVWLWDRSRPPALAGGVANWQSG